MTKELKKIKTRYGGTCAKCGREIESGWDVYFNPAETGKEKSIYCKPCGQAIISGKEVAEIGVPENLDYIAKFDDLQLRLDALSQQCNDILARVEATNQKFDNTLLDKIMRSKEEKKTKAKGKTAPK